MPPIVDPNVIVGIDTHDDAAVYRLTDELAMVLTVDLFPPVVDDPYSYGAIAVANSLSDVYAMGAKPLAALNIIGFPAKRLSLSILEEILRGGSDKATEAGIGIVGGHSLDDEEPKYGLAVFGMVHPERVVTNATAQVGDDLILTKPLGIGIITTAIKIDHASPELIERTVAIMATLNDKASEVMLRIGINACTDITGFGLLGHLHEMVAASKVGARISLQDVPVIPETWALVNEGIAPGGTHANHDFLKGKVVWPAGFSLESQLVLCDAQTSGGLLIAVPRAKSATLLVSLREAGISEAACIGEIVEDHHCRIHVTP